MDADAEQVPEHCRALLPVLRQAVAEQPPTAAPACWEAVFDQAEQQDVAAFLYPIVRLWPPAMQPPEPLLARWRSRFLTAVAAAARRTEQAKELLAALVADGITAIPLKGIWLAEQVYADPAQRPMCDIDLLVPPSALDRARRTLARLGYAICESELSDRYDYALTACCPRHALAVELHWQLGSEQTPEMPRPDLSGLWQRLVPETVAGVRVPTLTDEEQAVLLAYHALHHAFAMPLRELLDLALLLKRRGATWTPERFAIVAADWGLARAAPLLASLVSELLDVVPPPACVSPALPVESKSRQQVMQTMLAASEYRNKLGESTLLEFSRRGFWSRLSLLFQRVAVPRSYLRREYVCARSWLGLPIAYAQRAWDLARQRHSGIWRILRRDATVTRRLDQVAERTRLVSWFLR